MSLPVAVLPGEARSAYARDAVLSASPARLLVMLYDRLLLDLARAEAARAEGEGGRAVAELFHAQTIVLELSSSLETGRWSGAAGLLSLYGYLSRLIARATTEESAEPIRECARLVAPLAEAWREAASAGAGATRTGGIDDVG